MPAQRRVWIVEDSALDAERARSVLLRDYDVRVFHDGASALEELSRGNAPDVMLLDWVMPGVSGLDVCRFLRSSSHVAKTIGVLMLTGQRQTRKIVEGLRAGANDYLAKPYESDELSARVGALMRARELLDRAEQAEQLTRQLFESAPDALLAVAADGTLSFANAQARRVLGIAADGLAGRNISELIPGFAELVSQTASDRSPVLRDITVNGRTLAPTAFLSSGGPGLTTIALRDVTEQRSKDARRLDFYSIIAHDLRTPLNAIALRTELILRGKHGQLAEGLATDVRKIDTHVKSLVSLITDFLELARLEGTPEEVRRDEVDLAVLLERTMDDFKPLLERAQLVWREGPAPRTTVLGDERRLAQVFGNLVANAIKFTPPGGEIQTGIVLGPAEVECFVSDTGCGVPEHDLPKLFQRYSRASEESGKAPGTGLGLMIVREIVEAHGGKVWVESVPGQGSRFAFRLPRSDSGLQASSP